MHTEEPQVDDILGIWYTGHHEKGVYISDDKLPDGINPQWDDNEPIKIKLKLEKDERRL